MYMMYEWLHGALSRLSGGPNELITWHGKLLQGRGQRVGDAGCGHCISVAERCRGCKREWVWAGAQGGHVAQ